MNSVGANCGSPASLQNSDNNNQTDQAKPFRKNIRLKGYNYALIGAYFITICCHEKQHLFGSVHDGEMHLNSYGMIVREEWLRTQSLRKNIVLDAFVVMPNHFHAIIIIQDDKIDSGIESSKEGAPQYAPTVGDIMKGFKQAVTMCIRAKGFDGMVWQRGYYDHIIRNVHDYNATVDYIQNNPQNWHRDKNNQVGG